MTDGAETRFPVERAEPERTVSTAFDALHHRRPGFCPDCDLAVAPDTRFCPSCRCCLPAPHMGQLASPKRRLAAGTLDSVMRDGGLLGSTLWPAIMPSGAASTVITILSASYGLASLFLWTRGTTPAKHLFKMTVITEEGEPAGFWRMAYRETIGKMISGLVLGLGFLAIPRSPERRGWHDIQADTWVVFDDDE